MIGLILGFALMASAISANKIVMFVLPSTLYTGIRMLSAGLILLAIVGPRNERMRWSYIKHDIRDLFLVGFCTTYVTSLLKAWALKNLLSSKAALIAGLDPFVAALYAYMLWGEKLSFKKWCGLLLGFGGVLILISGHSSVEAMYASIGMVSLPELAAFAAMAIGRYGWILAAQFLKRNRYTSMELNGISMTSSGIVALATAYFVDPIITSVQAIDATTAAAITYSVVIGNVISYNVYGYFLKNFSLTLVSLFGFVIPLTVALIGWLFLGEVITQTFLAAAAVTLVGLAVFYADEIKKDLLPLV